MIDFGRREIVPIEVLIEEVIELTAEDADRLGCTTEVEALRTVLAHGTSADQQRVVLEEGKRAGKSDAEALRGVVTHLIEEFHADL